MTDNITTTNVTRVTPSEYKQLCDRLERRDYRSSSYNKLIISKFDDKYHTIDYQGEVYMEEFDTLNDLHTFYNLKPNADAETESQMDIFEVLYGY